ncbi:MAG: hypothetical protein JXA21_25420 [Anaerolineae bacterium]|nr:hypothetical protein [Anaerolineae bacterium]
MKERTSSGYGKEGSKRNREALRLGLLLALYLLTGLSYIWVTPCLEKPDEEDHYGYLRYVREHHRLPPLAPQEKGLFESKQPPLYYVLAALATAPLKDVADPETLIVQNPYLDFSVPGYREDNRNVYLHPPSMTGVVFGGRCVSLLFGVGTMLNIYWLVKLLLPGNAGVALAAAATVGFQPMFLFIATSLSNDAPLAYYATATLALLSYRQRWGGSRYFPPAMGVLLGLGALTKVSALAFFPIVGLSLWLIRKRLDKELLKELLVIGLVALAVGGWWYGRNALLYHDPFTLNAHIAPATQARPLLTYFWQDLGDIERTFWGNLARVFVSFTWLDWAALWWGRISAAVALVAAWQQRRLLTRRYVDVTLLALWPSTFGVLLLGFWTRQANWAWGRFLMPAIGPLMLSLLLGWRALEGRARPWGLWGAAGAMVLAGVLAPWLVIYPLYHPYHAPKGIAYPANVTLQDAGGRPVARFLGYNLPQPVTTPGSYTPVEICWETLGVTEKPLTLFVHWLDLASTKMGAQPAVVGGRDTYPGLGNLPTSRWPLGMRFCDRVLAQVSETTAAPLATVLEIGLWDPGSGERLRYGLPDGQVTDWMILKGATLVDEKTTLAATGTPAPSYVFDGRIQLLGLRQSRAGSSLTLTTTWTAAANPPYDAVMFVHVQDGQGKAVAQVDRQPMDGRVPTSYWYPGIILTDTLTLDLATDAPVTVMMGLYTLPDVTRLPLLDAQGIAVPDNALRLAP